MKQIWIRKPVTLRTQIIAGASGLLIVLAVWLVITTVRKPPQLLSAAEVHQKITEEDDLDYLARFYSFNESSDQYILKDKLTTRQKIRAWYQLDTSGLLPEGHWPNPLNT